MTYPDRLTLTESIALVRALRVASKACPWCAALDPWDDGILTLAFLDDARWLVTKDRSLVRGSYVFTCTTCQYTVSFRAGETTIPIPPVLVE